jgi:hypothetical protein
LSKQLLNSPENLNVPMRCAETGVSYSGIKIGVFAAPEPQEIL